MKKTRRMRLDGASSERAEPMFVQIDASESAMRVADQWVLAVNQQNIEAVAEVFAPDAHFFGTTSTSVITSIESIKEYFSGVFATCSSLALSLGPVAISELSPTSAVITGHDKWNVTANGKQIEMFGRLTLVVQELQGTWKIVSFHRSAIPN